MLLKVIDDLCAVTTMLADLVRDLITELEHERNIQEAVKVKPGKDGTEERTPALEEYKKRADEAEKLLDTIEYNNRRL